MRFVTVPEGPEVSDEVVYNRCVTGLTATPKAVVYALVNPRLTCPMTLGNPAAEAVETPTGGTDWPITLTRRARSRRPTSERIRRDIGCLPVCFTAGGQWLTK